MLGEKDCRGIVERCLGASKADQLRVSLSQRDVAHLRFARNVPSTSGRALRQTVTAQSVFGTRTGSAAGNQLDPASLEALVRRSEEVARLSPEDPEHTDELGFQDYVPVEAHGGEGADARIEAMAAGVAECIDQARRAAVVAAGFVQASEDVRALATSAGLFGYHRSTVASFSETARTPDATGSGWASAAAQSAGAVDFAGRSRVAIEKARRSAQPRRLEPGDYPAVLEPACVASLLRLFLRSMPRGPPATISTRCIYSAMQ